MFVDGEVGRDDFFGPDDVEQRGSYRGRVARLVCISRGAGESEDVSIPEGKLLRRKLEPGEQWTRW
jgi:hypothetical protein